jgi:hypothetical protein
MVCIFSFARIEDSLIWTSRLLYLITQRWWYNLLYLILLFLEYHLDLVFSIINSIRVLDWLIALDWTQTRRTDHMSCKRPKNVSVRANCLRLPSFRRFSRPYPHRKAVCRLSFVLCSPRPCVATAHDVSTADPVSAAGLIVIS